jgi:hypothetical protein
MIKPPSSKYFLSAFREGKYVILFLNFFLDKKILKRYISKQKNEN